MRAPGGPLTGRPVVLTRRPEQTGDLEAGLRAAGRPVLFCPLTDFEATPDEARLRAAVAELASGAFAWLVVTSPTTARALARAGWGGRVTEGTRVAVTGPGTARALADAGFSGRPWMPEGVAAGRAIVREFPTAPERTEAGAGAPAESTADRRVLLPQSALASAEVADGLRAQGWEVEQVEAYRTVPYPADPTRALIVPARAEGGRSGQSPDVVVGLAEVADADLVLTSPSAVRELAAHPTWAAAAQDGGALARTVRCVAIGEPTRAEAERHGIDLTATAATPDAAGVLAALGHGATGDEPGTRDAEFAVPGPLRDRLVGLILTGAKTATASLLREWHAAGEALPQPGSRERVLDSTGDVAAVIETVSVAVVPFGDVGDDHARAEGEGDLDAGAWRRSHEEFWGGPIADDEPVVLQRFVRIR